MVPGTVKRSIASNTYVPNAHLCNKAQFLLQAITTVLKTLLKSSIEIAFQYLVDHMGQCTPIHEAPY